MTAAEFLALRARMREAAETSKLCADPATTRAIRLTANSVGAVLQPSPRRRRALRAEPIPSEHEEMVTLAAWLDARKLLWCHPFNEGRRSFGAAARAKATGLKPGVPDALIFTPPSRLARGTSVGVAIELKRRKGGVVSPEQRAWIEKLERAWWIVFVAKGAGHAIELLEPLYGSVR